jgi:hypothetical protein
MSEFKKIIGLTLLSALVLMPTATITVSGAANGGLMKSNAAAFGVIRGNVRDDRGAPIAGAIVALWRDGMASVRQIRSSSDGSFVARVLPGRYSLTAMAEGYSVVSLSNVDVARADDVAFRFNLTQMGSGRTLPERKADRGSAKYGLRSNAGRRSIFQNNEGTGETVAQLEEIEDAIEENASVTNDEEHSSRRASQSAVETYFATSSNQQSVPYFGLNFATVQPVSDKFDVIFAGQTGFGDDAPQRIESIVRLKLNDRHRISFNFGGAKLGKVQLDDANGEEDESELGQISFQALDEWRVRDGVILVLGVDYARFVGASDADSINPRVGLQLEADAKTRFNFAYTTQTEQRTWQQAAELEDSRVLFRQPNFESYAIADRQVLMPRLRRLEFGVERVLDNASNIEAAAFFDATTNRGISFVQTPFGFSATETDFDTSIQNGSAQGARVVYSRRFNRTLSASLGYAAGRGQALSANNLRNPAGLFDDEFFQTLAAELSANFDTGTEIRGVWRRSSRRAVFAIDPFANRIAFFEPSVSVLVTQNLPTLGLPLRAKATFDARNLFDLQTAASNGETTLRLNNARRLLRGGIAVRF